MKTGEEKPMPRLDDSMDELMASLAIKLGETLGVAQAQGRARNMVLGVLQFFLGAAEADGDSETCAILQDSIRALEPLVSDEGK